MDIFKDLANTLRIITGSVIIIHGLSRIVLLSNYFSFVLEQFYDIFPAENVLTIGAALLPFIEFFIGLLIITNVCIKKTVGAAFFISMVMVFFIMLKDLYPRLIYHCFVVGLLLIVYITSKKQANTYT